jgi:hypothetical protein
MRLPLCIVLEQYGLLNDPYCIVGVTDQESKLADQKSIKAKAPQESSHGA